MGSIFVHVDSSHKLKTDINSKISISVPGGLKSCSEVCVKSFSVANTGYNIHDDKCKLHFANFSKKPDGFFEGHDMHADSYVTIEQGYYTHAELVEALNTALAGGTLFRNINDGSTEGDAGTGIKLNLNFGSENNKTTVNYSKTAGDTDNHVRYWAPLLRFNGDAGDLLWKELGFSEDQCYHKILGPTTATQAQFDKYNWHLCTDEEQTLVSRNPHSIENLQGIHICSDALSTGSYSSYAGENGHTGQNFVRKSNILQYISNTVQRDHYLHWNAELPEWHQVNSIVNNFDLQVRTHADTPYSGITAGWKIVLEFKQHPLNSMASLSEQVKCYNKIGYDLAHPRA
jgi:hypothetical protein